MPDIDETPGAVDTIRADAHYTDVHFTCHGAECQGQLFVFAEFSPDYTEMFSNRAI